MNNQLIPFNFEEKEVRIVIVDGQEWWVGKDVAESLGFKDTVNAIKQHCNGVVKYHPITDAMGRTQEARIINEGDVFRLMTHSNQPRAQRFEKWLFEEVLPQIRRTGGYAPLGMALVREDVLEQMKQDIATIKGDWSLIRYLMDKNEKLEDKNEKLKRRGTHLTDHERWQILACARRLSVAEIARETGRSETAVRKVIRYEKKMSVIPTSSIGQTGGRHEVST